MIVIINYGMGNLGSMQNMLKKIGYDSLITSDPMIIEKADKLILPGVGAFDQAMNNLKRFKLLPLLNKQILSKHVPILGVCLGMQLLSQKSEEGILPGLGWIKAETVKFNFSDNDNILKIPHMGWNTLEIQKNNNIIKNLNNESRFYFVHSYHVRCFNTSDVLTTTNYGIKFISMIQNNNIYGAQFHPEKSHKFGMQLLKNFIEL